MARAFAVLAVLLAAGCAAIGWDCVCYGGAPSQTHLVNAQLLAELARDGK